MTDYSLPDGKKSEEEETEDTKLPPCPFCGHPMTLCSYPTSDDCWWIVCDCGWCSWDFPTQEEAVKWAKRRWRNDER